MSKAPSAVFRREDYPDLQTEDQRDRFFRQLNTFCRQVQALASNGITFGENCAAALKELTADADGAGAITASFQAKLAGGAKPAGVWLLRAVSLAGQVETPVSLGNPAWSSTANGIAISALSGGVAGTRYRLTFLVVGG